MNLHIISWTVLILTLIHLICIIYNFTQKFTGVANNREDHNEEKKKCVIALNDFMHLLKIIM